MIVLVKISNFKFQINSIEYKCMDIKAFNVPAICKIFLFPNFAYDFGLNYHSNNCTKDYFTVEVKSNFFLNFNFCIKY